MKFSAILALASVAIASPLAAPNADAPSGTVEQFLASYEQGSDELVARDAQAALRSNTTAGAIRRAPAGNGFTSTTSTFVLPNPVEPAGTKQGHVSFIDVGIGARGPHAGILVDSRPNNPVIYVAYYGFAQASGQLIGNLGSAPGDSITATLTVINATAGTATLRNARTGQSNTVNVSGQAGQGEYAAFTIADIPRNETVPYQNFGTLPFSASSARAGGAVFTLTGADTTDIFSDSTGARISQTTITSSTGLSIQYVGPK